MTGFGRSEGQVGNSRFTVEIKSVNHRYLDLRFRLPVPLAMFELRLAEALRQHFERGSFEIVARQKLSADTAAGQGGTKFVVDQVALESLLEACELIHKKYKIEKLPNLETLALTNRIFVPVEESGDQEKTFEDLKSLFDRAVTDLIEMRGFEGKRLETILEEGIGALGQCGDKIRLTAPEQGPKVLEKLKQKIAQWKLGEVDSQRLEWELAFYAERADITEELDRLKAHTEEFGKLLHSKKAIGRKLDFLTQEMHREVNTMGSKASLLSITQLTVEAKTTIEKLREQVQNVE
jgi:uncharacterized protein (TIGR00255 family)